MDAVAPLAVSPRPATQVLATWLAEAWRLFRRAPVRLFLLSLLPMVVEAMLQMVPAAGVVLSKLLVPLAGAWVLALVHHKAVGGRFASAAASWLWRVRLPSLLWWVALCFAVFVCQVLITAAIAGPGQAVALATADAGQLRLGRVELACVFASGMLFSLPLMFCLPRLLLDGVPIARALADSVRALREYWGAIAVLSLVSMVLVASVLWFPPVLLLLLPASLMVGYTSYRDVFDRVRAG